MRRFSGLRTYDCRVNERWIANASPLILLGKVGLLDLLTGAVPGSPRPRRCFSGIVSPAVVRPGADMG